MHIGANRGDVFRSTGYTVLNYSTLAVWYSGLSLSVSLSLKYKFRGLQCISSPGSSTSNSALISPLIRSGVDFLEAGAIFGHRCDTERNERIVRGVDAAARTVQSHNLWHRRRAAKGKEQGTKRKGKDRGRLTVREREGDRSATETLRYQRGGGSERDARTNILYTLYRPYQMASSDVT